MFWIFIIISLGVTKVFDIFNVLRLVSRQSEEMLCRDPNQSAMKRLRGLKFTFIPLSTTGKMR